MPVETLYCPVPSTFRRSEIFVSSVLRSTTPTRAPATGGLPVPSSSKMSLTVPSLKLCKLCACKCEQHEHQRNPYPHQMREALREDCAWCAHARNTRGQRYCPLPFPFHGHANSSYRPRARRAASVRLAIHTKNPANTTTQITTKATR